MKKRRSLLILFMMSNSAFSQPVNYIKGSFRASNTLDKIYFLPTENQTFTSQEILISDHWLKKGLEDTKYRYDDLTVYLDFIGNVRRNVKNCFNSWFKKLDINIKVHLMEQLKPDGTTSLTFSEINAISDELNKYTTDNLNRCQNDDVLGDISTVYISIALDQYLSDKSNSRPYNEKYNAIFEKQYNQQYKNAARDEQKKFQTVIESFQNIYPSIQAEVVNEFINIVQNLKLENVNETESSFLFIQAANNKITTFKDDLSDYQKMIPFIKSSKFIFNKCFDQGHFLLDKCSSDNIGNYFTVIQLKRKTKTLNHLIWTEQ